MPEVVKIDTFKYLHVINWVYLLTIFPSTRLAGARIFPFPHTIFGKISRHNVKSCLVIKNFKCQNSALARAISILLKKTYFNHKKLLEPVNATNKSKFIVLKWRSHPLPRRYLLQSHLLQSHLHLHLHLQDHCQNSLTRQYREAPWNRARLKTILVLWQLSRGVGPLKSVTFCTF